MGILTRAIVHLPKSEVNIYKRVNGGASNNPILSYPDIAKVAGGSSWSGMFTLLSGTIYFPYAILIPSTD